MAGTLTQNPLLAGASGGLQPNSLFDDYASSFGAAVPNGAADWAAEQVRQQRAQSVSMGLLDPNTGWPTTAGWKDAAQQYANGLLMGSTAPKGNGLLAYHGSPHDFDAFSLDKIGTGEGAQAYGHGMYFAQNEGTAKYYRDALAGEQGTGYRWIDRQGRVYDPHPLAENAESGDPAALAASMLRQRNSVDEALQDATKYGPDAFIGGKPEMDATVQGLRALKEAGLERQPYNGRMYEVNLNVQPHELLDWDKPLSEQSPQVQQGLAQAGINGIHPSLQRAIADSGGVSAIQDGMAMPGGGKLRVEDGGPGFAPRYYLETDAGARFPLGKPDIDRMLGQSDPTISGRDAYSHLTDKAGDATAAASALNQAGIKGIRYLDQGSRGSGEGTSNFVMFDPATIEILRKYGIAGLGLGTAAAAADQPTTP